MDGSRSGSGCDHTHRMRRRRVYRRRRVFALRKPNPVLGWFEFHEVFHLGTVIGYACHVVAIYLIVCAL